MGMEADHAAQLCFEGKNYHEPLIDEAHTATAHDGVDYTMQYLTNRYQSQS